MSVRVGIDLVDVESVRETLDRHAGHYLQRVYTEGEVNDCSRCGTIDPQRLAARFAAKEAVLKVLRPSSDQPVPWRSIGVRLDRSGRPNIELDGHAAAAAKREGLGSVSLSMSHEQGSAVAVAFAEVGSRA